MLTAQERKENVICKRAHLHIAAFRYVNAAERDIETAINKVIYWIKLLWSYHFQCLGSCRPKVSFRLWLPRRFFFELTVRESEHHVATEGN